jgi:hypothetical protein
MLENIYRIDGKYPDPHEIERELKNLSSDPEKFSKAKAELYDAGLDSHPLLGRFFVES